MLCCGDMMMMADETEKSERKAVHATQKPSQCACGLCGGVRGRVRTEETCGLSLYAWVWGGRSLLSAG